MNGENLRLCYLDASRVGSPAGDLGGLKIETDSEQRLGSLDGVLIDASERRVRFFVVKSARWFNRRRYLISTDCTAKLEPERNTLRLGVHTDDLASFDEFDTRTVRDFSDEDAVEAMFARHVA